MGVRLVQEHSRTGVWLIGPLDGGYGNFILEQGCGLLGRGSWMTVMVISFQNRGVPYWAVG